MPRTYRDLLGRTATLYYGANGRRFRTRVGGRSRPDLNPAIYMWGPCKYVFRIQLGRKVREDGTRFYVVDESWALQGYIGDDALDWYVARKEQLRGVLYVDVICQDGRERRIPTFDETTIPEIPGPSWMVSARDLLLNELLGG